MKNAPHDLVYLYFEAEIKPGERVTILPVRAERRRARSLPEHFTSYGPPVEVPADSIRPFLSREFIFSVDLDQVLEMSVAYQNLRLTSLKTGVTENIASPYLKDGLPLQALLHVNACSCESAAQVSLGIWNPEDEPVPFKVRCVGPTMPEEM